MSASSNLARTTNDTCPWSVTDTHATLRRSRTRFDSWLGHYENNPSRLWPASVTDSTTDFESVRRGSTPWRAAQQQTARYANGIAAKLKPWCLWVRLPPVLLAVITMKANKQFTIRLANGREETFDNASAMVEWMDRQRGLEYRGSRSQSKPRVRCQPRRKQTNTNEAPLARYANRHSGEA